MKIGIIGNGFVGSAILHGFILHVDDIMIYDKDPKRSTHTMEELVDKSDIIFNLSFSSIGPILLIEASGTFSFNLVGDSVVYGAAGETIFAYGEFLNNSDSPVEIKVKRIKPFFKNGEPFVVWDEKKFQLMNLHIHSKRFKNYLPKEYKNYI